MKHGVPLKPVIVMTIGHSTRPVAEFIRLLKAHEVKRLVDVRTVPTFATQSSVQQGPIGGQLAFRSASLQVHAWTGRLSACPSRFHQYRVAERQLPGLCRLHADA